MSGQCGVLILRLVGFRLGSAGRAPGRPCCWRSSWPYRRRTTPRGEARRCGDDDGHITKPELQSVDGLRRIWLEPGATQQYYPVLHSAFWFEHRVWKDAPFGYHLTNIVLHSIAAFLIFLLLRELGVLAPCWRGYVLSYVVSPDGQRFLINTVIEQPATAPITVILNWKPGR
jgi:hypothetical protein